MSKPVDKKRTDATIALNKKARHDFSIEETVEAGLALEGWEVKSLREGRGQIKEAYVLIKGGQAYLFGAHFTPPDSVSSLKDAVPRRNRKLLLHRKELDRLIGAVERKGYTMVPLKLYWKRGMAKLEVGLAKGKKKVDKRADEKAKDWERQKARIMRHKA